MKYRLFDKEFSEGGYKIKFFFLYSFQNIGDLFSRVTFEKKHLEKNNFFSAFPFRFLLSPSLQKELYSIVDPADIFHIKISKRQSYHRAWNSETLANCIFEIHHSKYFNRKPKKIVELLYGQRKKNRSL